MTPPYQGLRVLLIAQVDDAFQAHNGLRRRALERLGAEVQHVDPERSGLFERLVRRDLDQRITAVLDQHRPDLVLVVGEETVPSEAVERLRSGRDSRWAIIYGDEVRDLERSAAAAMAYDRVFLGSTGAVESFDRRGVKHVHYLAMACDPSVHKPLRARGPFRANVVFAGVATARREQYLAELVEFGLALWGPGWRKTSLRDYCRGELPSTEDFVRAYAGATVAINVHKSGPDTRGGDPSGVNRRAFELAAIGTTQVIDDRPDLARHFEDGTEVLVYHTPEQLRGQVKRALQEDKYRERLAGNGRQRALQGHTYMHRMRELLGVVTGGGSDAPGP